MKPIFVSHLQPPRHCLLCELNTAPTTCQRKAGAYKPCAPWPQLPRRCIASNYASLSSISFSPQTKDLLFGPKKSFVNLKPKEVAGKQKLKNIVVLEIKTTSWKLKGWEKQSSDFYHKVKGKEQKKQRIRKLTQLGQFQRAKQRLRHLVLVKCYIICNTILC